MNIRTALYILASLILSGCGSAVTVDYDTSRSFGRDRTYSWAPNDGSDKAAMANDPSVGALIMQRVETSTDTALAEMGYSRAPSGNADLLVAAYIKVETKYEETAYGGAAYGCCYGGSYHRIGGWGGYSVGMHPEINAYQEASLYIDIVDSKTKRAVWRGVLSKRIFGQRTPQERNAYIDKCVREILARFPRAGSAVMPAQ